MRLTRLRSIKHDGLSYQKILPIEPSVFLIVAQRELADTKDVVQTVFLRLVANLDFKNYPE